MQLAVLEHDEDSVVTLLRLQARLDTIDAMGLSPLFHAARNGQQRLVRILLAAGAAASPEHQQWLRHLSDWGIKDQAILRLISAALTTCASLTSLARASFRSFARERSASTAASLEFPARLVEFIDYADVVDDDDGGRAV